MRRRASWLALVVVATGCGAGESPAGDERPDASAVTSASTEATCANRLATSANPTPRDFETEVMPIFELSCNFGSCHEGTGNGTQLRLGPKCQLDSATGECNFDPGALSAATLDAIHATLMMQSSNGGHLPRVSPGKPDQSFLLIKLAGCQDELAGAAGCSDCGGPMPPTSNFYEMSPARYALLLDWVSRGAPR